MPKPWYERRINQGECAGGRQHCSQPCNGTCALSLMEIEVLSLSCSDILLWFGAVQVVKGCQRAASGSAPAVCSCRQTELHDTNSQRSDTDSQRHNTGPTGARTACCAFSQQRVSGSWCWRQNATQVEAAAQLAAEIGHLLCWLQRPPSFSHNHMRPQSAAFSAASIPPEPDKRFCLAKAAEALQGQRFAALEQHLARPYPGCTQSRGIGFTIGWLFGFPAPTQLAQLARYRSGVVGGGSQLGACNDSGYTRSPAAGV